MSYIFTNSQSHTYYYLNLLFNHDKLFKFTALQCNPAFMPPLNLAQQLMSASTVVPFTQSHSNEQNLSREREN